VTALERAVSKARKRLLPILLLCYFAAFLDRVNVGFAALQMNHTLSLTASAFGIGAGMFFVGYVLFEIPSNLILVRVGARTWIARIMVSWGLLSAATAFVWSAHSYDIARLLLGAAEAGFFPGMLFYLTQWFPRAYRSRMFGTVAFAVPIASIIGAPVSSYVLQAMNGVMGLHGWQWLFLLEGLPALIMGIVVVIALPSRPQDAKWLTEDECNALLSVLRAERESRERVEQFTVWRAMTDGRVLMMCLVAVGLVIGNTGSAIWMPQIIHSFGADTMETGLLTMLPSIGALAALAFCGWNADRTGERVWHVAGPFLIAGLGFILAAYANAPALRLLGLILGMAGAVGASPSVWVLPSMLLTSTAAAAGLALINSTGSIGGFVGPTVIGWIRDATGSFADSLLFLAATMIATALLALILGYWMRDILNPTGQQRGEAMLSTQETTP
jgi:ACS family tartrate transporter-like MFS transporter